MLKGTATPIPMRHLMQIACILAATTQCSAGSHAAAGNQSNHPVGLGRSLLSRRRDRRAGTCHLSGTCTCDTTNWPELVRKKDTPMDGNRQSGCASCEALVKGSISCPGKRCSCKKYCNTIGLDCQNMREDGEPGSKDTCYGRGSSNPSTCERTSGSSDTICECKERNPCAGNTCSGNGQCSNSNNKKKSNGQAKCSCKPGFSGSTCATNVNECNPKPCKNDGTCTDKVNSFSCSCKPGFSGSTCETNINECKPKPCKNGGTCTDKVNSYACNCKSGYSGTQCQTASTTATSTTATTTTRTTTTTTTTTPTLCTAGEFRTQPGNTCRACPKGTWRSDKSHSITECIAHSVCAGHEYVEKQPTATRNVVCRSSVPCGEMEWESEPPIAGVGERECTPVTQCVQGEYVKVAASSTSDQSCAPCSDASAASFAGGCTSTTTTITDTTTTVSSTTTTATITSTTTSATTTTTSITTTTTATATTTTTSATSATDTTTTGTTTTTTMGAADLEAIGITVDMLKDEMAAKNITDAQQVIDLLSKGFNVTNLVQAGYGKVNIEAAGITEVEYAAALATAFPEAAVASRSSTWRIVGIVVGAVVLAISAGILFVKQRNANKEPMKDDKPRAVMNVLYEYANDENEGAASHNHSTLTNATYESVSGGGSNDGDTAYEDMPCEPGTSYISTVSNPTYDDGMGGEATYSDVPFLKDGSLLDQQGGDELGDENNTDGNAQAAVEQEYVTFNEMQGGMLVFEDNNDGDDDSIEL